MDIISFFVSAIRIGMAFLFGSTGETITEKAGHLNLGIPGIMCVGAASGCVAEAIYTKAAIANRDVIPAEYFENVSPVLAVLIPIVAAFLGAMLMGLIYSLLTVTLRANQNVTGLALTTFGIGLSDYLISMVKTSDYSYATRFFTAHLPFADNLGWFGKMFLSYGIMVYLAIIVALVSAFILTKTKVGLYLRAVGENPATADAAGINVTKYRYLATLIGSGIAGLGGMTYVFDTLNGNWEYVIDAVGWLSIALVIFTVWKPNLGIFGSIIFGALFISSNFIGGVPTEYKAFLKMIPYVVTILVLIITSIMDKKENQPPQGLGLNYYREDR